MHWPKLWPLIMTFVQWHLVWAAITSYTVTWLCVGNICHWGLDTSFIRDTGDSSTVAQYTSYRGWIVSLCHYTVDRGGEISALLLLMGDSWCHQTTRFHISYHGRYRKSLYVCLHWFMILQWKISQESKPRTVSKSTLPGSFHAPLTCLIWIRIDWENPSGRTTKFLLQIFGKDTI